MQDPELPRGSAVEAGHGLVEHLPAAVDAPELLAAGEQHGLELELDLDEDRIGPPRGRPVGEPVETWLVGELLAPLRGQDPSSDFEPGADREVLQLVEHVHSVGGFGLYVQRQRTNNLPCS